MDIFRLKLIKLRKPNYLLWSIFLFSPLNLVRFTADPLNILLKLSSSKFSQSLLDQFTISSLGRNSFRSVSFENFLFQGQTSWQISHHKSIHEDFLLILRTLHGALLFCKKYISQLLFCILLKH